MEQLEKPTQIGGAALTPETAPRRESENALNTNSIGTSATGTDSPNATCEDPTGAEDAANAEDVALLPKEPRWPSVLAVLAVVGLYAALPQSLSVGPRWLMGVVIGVLLLPTIWAHQNEHHHWNQFFGFLLLGAETFALVGSLFLLVASLPTHRESPVVLLRSAAALWVTNVLVFALWYWRLDAGGPHHRDSRLGHECGAFLFPQMTIAPDSPAFDAQWSPNFVDYLFLAFNGSTALSPTDAPVMSRWAKLLMIVQASISLTVIALLAARGVNIL